MRVALLCLALTTFACGSTGVPVGDGGGNPGADLSGGGGSTDLAQSGSTDLAMSAQPDLSSPSGDLAGGLCCGQPGDVGNNLGVGKYCNGFTDCAGQQASICANIGDPNVHFCTMLCSAGGNCGAGATCQCQGTQCGCFPDSCLTMPAGC